MMKYINEFFKNIYKRKNTYPKDFGKKVTSSQIIMSTCKSFISNYYKRKSSQETFK